jgi:hypothetical protein
MDRRLLFPAVVASAWAQQTSPAAAEAEKALRARAEQFYQLEVDKKFRLAEAIVAEDTKDYFYNNGKPDIRNYRIDKVEIAPDGTHAKLTTTVTAVMKAAGFPSQDVSVPVHSTWKLENSQWMWYVEQATIETPFGKVQASKNDSGEAHRPPGIPDLGNLQNLVSIDRTSVDLTAGNPKPETVTISNQMPGPISVQVATERPKGLTVQIDKSQLETGEKAVVSFSVLGDAKPSGAVRISAGPLQEFVIQIRTR